MITMMLTFDLYIDLRKPLTNISINIIVIDNLIITIDLCLKHIMLNEIIIYEKSKTINLLTNLFNKY